ncbi:MAG: TetR/AcrR family transcriptional regulator [Lachnospiraceae bacterium]
MKKINKIVTSREAILKTCRELAAEQGLQSLNMRAVAQKSHVSIGSIYNYFPSKAEFIAATIQEVWHEIFHMGKVCKEGTPFSEYVEEIFRNVQEGAARYPTFFTSHSLSFANAEKGKAKQVMEEYVTHMKVGLLKTLQNDKKVRENAFSTEFTQSEFVGFVFTSLISLLMNQESSCKILIEMIKRSIYEANS